MTPQLNLRQAADCLDIEPWRVFRLSRYLDVDPYKPTIPGDEVEKIALVDDPDERYTMLRDWLLDRVPQLV